MLQRILLGEDSARPGRKGALKSDSSLEGRSDGYIRSNFLLLQKRVRELSKWELEGTVRPAEGATAPPRATDDELWDFHVTMLTRVRSSLSSI